MEDKPYYIEPIDFEDTQTKRQALSLLLKVFGNPAIFTEKWWCWKFLESPFGKSIGWCARDSYTRDVIGLRILWRWKLFFENGDTDAFQMTDAVTDDNYRGIGVFSELTKMALNGVSDSVIFNFPNKNSAPINLKMGWKEMKNQPWLLMISFPSFRSDERVGLFHKNMDFLPNIISCTNIKFHSTLWTHELLKWRFENHPFNTYYFYSIRDSFIIYRIDSRLTVKIATIMYTHIIRKKDMLVFSDFLFRQRIFFYRYNAYNIKLYDDLADSWFTCKIKKQFRYFFKTLNGNNIALTLADTDFL